MKVLLELTTDDCLDISDLLRARIATMSKLNLSEEDRENVQRLQKGFRRLSKEDYLEKFVVVRARE